MTTANELLQSFNVGAMVTLYELDATGIDGVTVFRFTDSTNGANPIVFDNLTYVPIPVDAEGFERDSNSAPARPKIKIGNVSEVLSSLLLEYGDLVGARLTRTRTFERFLTTGAEPDPDQTFGIEIYHISRKTEQNKVFVEFELATSLDQQNVQLPGRRQFRRHCTLTYRRWSEAAGAFDYTNVTCPYVAEASFDLNGVATAPENDVCAKHRLACKKRFTVLPMHAFPGMARVR